MKDSCFSRFFADFDDLSILLHIENVHILVEHQTLCALSLLLLIFMSDSNLDECFKTFLYLAGVFLPMSKKLIVVWPKFESGEAI